MLFTMNTKTVALVWALLLAGCGGGGASSPIPTSGAGTNTKATLQGGFANTRAGAANARSTKALTSALVPIADFVIFDSYVSYQPYAPTQIQAVAYYNPNSGAVPNPLPAAATWATSGAATGKTSNPQNGPGVLGQADSVGGVLLTAGGTFGVGNLTATAANGDTVTLQYNTYPGTAVDAESGYAGTKPCLTFTTSGATPSSTGDFCLAINADHTTSFTAPKGIALIQKPIDAVTSTDLAAISSATTSISAMTAIANPSDTWTLAFKTALGGTVTFMPVVVNANGDAQVNAGQPVYAAGQYHVGS